MKVFGISVALPGWFILAWDTNMLSAAHQQKRKWEMLSSDSQNLSTTSMLLALGVTAETRPACEKLCYLSSDSQNLSTTASMLL